MKRRIVLLGPPASGKGTQAEMITAKYGIPSASPGAMFREEFKQGTKLGCEAHNLTRDGRLVSDEIVCQVVKSWLEVHDGEFVFDGFPRSVGQALELERMLDARRTPVEVVLLLEADRETIANRVTRRLVCSACRTNVSAGLDVMSDADPCPKCGGALIHRSDDNLETLELRMREYAEKTESLIPYYRQRSLLTAINAMRAPKLVFGEIADILERT